MELRFAKIILYIGLFIGLLLIVGTVFRWKFLVDPPEEWAGVYSHARLNKWFGTEFLIAFNYILGTLFVLFTLFFLWKIYTGTLEFV
mgnify:CR=1 FL=1